MMTTQRFRLNAVSPDNDRSLRELVHLFTSCYGESYPIQNVYELQFWKSHIGTRFVSLLGELNGRVVFHLAYSENQGCSGSVHIEHLVCAPEFLDQLDLYGVDISEQLTTLADRRNWRTFLLSAIEGSPEISNFLREQLGFRELGIVPGYYPGFCSLKSSDSLQTDFSAGNSESRHSVQLFVRATGCGVTENKELFIPNRHRRVVSALCKKLELNRTLMRRKPPYQSDNSQFSIPADVRAISSNRYTTTGVIHTFIQPSLVSDRRQLSEHIRQQRECEVSVLFLNCEDPELVSVAHHLEQQGYIFGGYLPLFFGYDTVVYFNQECLQYGQVDSLREKSVLPDHSQSLLAAHILALATGL